MLTRLFDWWNGLGVAIGVPWALAALLLVPIVWWMRRKAAVQAMHRVTAICLMAKTSQDLPRQVPLSSMAITTIPLRWVSVSWIARLTSFEPSPTVATAACGSSGSLSHTRIWCGVPNF